ncbi:MAG: serine/threonine protein kinase [Polyangiaceae bacterium]|nr:serine/threonine protein kinase [Polyangiaceae bacterium]
MDYLEGQSLQQLLRKVGRKGLPLELHVRVLADMLTGLDYAHTLTDFDGTPLHVVHRDVSPHNVFVTYDGQVKVVDFGIAKAAGASTRTRTGVYKGKPAYIAPEQARALPVDARADVFAVGIMLWEAIAGRRMAEQADEMAILAARITAADPKIRDIVPDAPAELADACDKAMAHAREDRFESAQAMHEVLVGWLEQQPKRSGAKDLGAFVSQAFSEERAALRTKIDQQLKLIRESSHSRPIPVIELGSGRRRCRRRPGVRRSTPTRSRPCSARTPAPRRAPGTRAARAGSCGSAWAPWPWWAPRSGSRRWSTRTTRRPGAARRRARRSPPPRRSSSCCTCPPKERRRASTGSSSRAGRRACVVRATARAMSSR